MTSNLTEQPVVSPLAHRRDEVAERMQRLLMEHVINKTTDRGDHLTRNLATSYTDPARFEAEKRKLFRKLPVLAGLTRDVPNPGDKMLFEEAGPPILIVRAKDGGIRAYLNMCPHRAAKVIEVCPARLPDDLPVPQLDVRPGRQADRNAGLGQFPRPGPG